LTSLLFGYSSAFVTYLLLIYYIYLYIVYIGKKEQAYPFEIGLSLLSLSPTDKKRPLLREWSFV